MSAAEIGAFRKPFIESKVSKSEAALAADAFRKMTNDLCNSTDKTHDVMDGNFSIRRLLLKIGDEMYAKVFKQTNMTTGHVEDIVSFHEAGETEEKWGPRICSYVTGSGMPSVDRFDYPNAEQRKILEESPFTDENVEPLDDAVESHILSTRMGLNGGSIGVEEMNEIRKLLSAGTPLPYNTSE